jgi:hypothetical protein
MRSNHAVQRGRRRASGRAWRRSPSSTPRSASRVTAGGGFLIADSNNNRVRFVAFR